MRNTHLKLDWPKNASFSEVSAILASPSDRVLSREEE